MPNIDPVNFSMLTVYFFSALAGAMAYGCARTLCRQDGYIDLFDRFTLDGATPRYSFAEPIEALSITISMVYLSFFFVSCLGSPGGAWRFILGSAAYWVLLVCALTDLEDMSVYTILPVSAAIGGILLRAAAAVSEQSVHIFLDGIAGGVAGFSVFGIIMIMSRGGMGLGDGYLAGGVGCILGLSMTMTAVYSSLILGGLFSALLLLFGRAGRKTKIPFVPFILAGMMIAPYIHEVVRRIFGISAGIPFPW